MIDDKTTPPLRVNSKPQLLKCLLAAIALGILYSLTIGYGAGYIDFWVSTLPHIIGYIFGLFFFSAIIASIGFLLQRRARKPFVLTFVRCFWVIWILALLSIIVLSLAGEK